MCVQSLRTYGVRSPGFIREQNPMTSPHPGIPLSHTIAGYGYTRGRKFRIIFLWLYAWHWRQNLKQSDKVSNEGDTSKVSFRGVKGRDSGKVRDFFLSHPDEEFTPKDITLFCKIGHSSAKKICMRFYLKGYIESPLKNHYLYKRKVTADEFKIIQQAQNLLLHNIMITVGDTSGDKSGVRRKRGTNPKNLDSKFQVGEAQVKIFRYVKKVVMYIECSHNPLDIADFNRVLGAIEGHGYDLTGAEIRRIEVNVDVPDLNISGTNCIELRTFSKAWQRLYNKGNRLREEVIIRGAQIPLEEAIAVLRGRQAIGTNTLITVIEELKQEAKQSNLSTRQLYQLVANLLRRLDRIENTYDPAQKRLERTT